MDETTAAERRNEAITRAIALFSNEAFAVAKSYVAGEDAAPLQERAAALKTELPAVAARMQDADPAYRSHLNRTLSEARLDLDYVLGGGGRPSSIRLSHVIRANDPPASSAVL